MTVTIKRKSAKKSSKKNVSSRKRTNKRSKTRNNVRTMRGGAGNPGETGETGDNELYNKLVNDPTVPLLTDIRDISQMKQGYMKLPNGDFIKIQSLAVGTDVKPAIVAVIKSPKVSNMPKYTEVIKKRARASLPKVNPTEERIYEEIKTEQFYEPMANATNPMKNIEQLLEERKKYLNNPAEHHRIEKQLFDAYKLLGQSEEFKPSPTLRRRKSSVEIINLVAEAQKAKAKEQVTAHSRSSIKKPNPFAPKKV